jgi:feruloyl esterase
MMRAFYGAAARHSYFIGCAGGGREAPMEIQRYAADYGGVLVCGCCLSADPQLSWTKSTAAWEWVAQALAVEPVRQNVENKISAVPLSV